MERRITLTKLFTFSIIAIIIVTAITAFTFAKAVNNESNECRKLGGILVHGNGIGICLKIESSDNG